jgi:hypothetical protein
MLKRFYSRVPIRDLIITEIANQKVLIKKLSMTKEEILADTPWYLKYILRKRIEKMEQEFPDDDHAVMDRLLMSSNSEDTIWRYQAVKLFKRIQRQLEVIKNDRLVLDLQPTTEKSTDYFDVEFPLLIIHVWFLLRRLLFEGEAGKTISVLLVDQLWIGVENQVLQFKKLGYQVDAEVRTLHQIFYSATENLDDAIDKNDDALLAEHLYSLFKNDYMDSVKDIYEWTRYVRFHLYFMEHIPSADFLNSQWKFIDLRDPLIEGPK